MVGRRAFAEPGKVGWHSPNQIPGGWLGKPGPEGIVTAPWALGDVKKEFDRGMGLNGAIGLPGAGIECGIGWAPP